jgi:hypothetical protein
VLGTCHCLKGDKQGDATAKTCSAFFTLKKKSFDARDTALLFPRSS